MNMDLDLNPEDCQLCDGFGFYKFCLTGFGLDLDLITLFWNSLQLSVPFRSYRLLYLCCKFTSVGILISAEIVPYFWDHKAHWIIRRSIKNWALAVFFHIYGTPDYRVDEMKQNLDKSNCIQLLHNHSKCWVARVHELPLGFQSVITYEGV